jgi:hypothetical protein
MQTITYIITLIIVTNSILYHFICINYNHTFVQSFTLIVHQFQNEQKSHHGRYS